MSLGTLVLDEVVLPIEEVRLGEGAFLIQVTLPAKVGQAGGGGYVLFGPDGVLVARGRLTFKPFTVAKGATCVLDLALRIDGGLMMSAR